jgi:hypothetical protein
VLGHSCASLQPKNARILNAGHEAICARTTGRMRVVPAVESFEKNQGVCIPVLLATYPAVLAARTGEISFLGHILAAQEAIIEGYSGTRQGKCRLESPSKCPGRKQFELGPSTKIWPLPHRGGISPFAIHRPRACLSVVTYHVCGSKAVHFDHNRRSPRQRIQVDGTNGRWGRRPSRFWHGTAVRGVIKCRSDQCDSSSSDLHAVADVEDCLM